MAEHMTFNHGVRSSTLRWVTKKDKSELFRKPKPVRICFTPENTDCVLPDSDPRHTIYIYDRGSQYEFLRHLPGAYMWTSPVPYSTLTEAKLIQRECTRPDNVFKDLLVCRSNYRLSKAETELTQWLGRTISQLSD